MTNQAISTEILYAFLSHGVSIIEIRYPESASESESAMIPAWLLIPETGEGVTALTFASMSNEEGLEFREFTEGELSFDDNICEWAPNDGLALALDRIRANEIPDLVYQVVLKFVEGIQNTK